MPSSGATSRAEAAAPALAPAAAAPGLYLHVPFCSAICPYCDFAVTRGGAEARRAFARTLAQEAGRAQGFGSPFDTVYLGGGTPSALAPGDLEAVLAAVRASLPVAEGAALFLEANPEDVDRDRLRAWKALGVRFLSLGVQSFRAGELRFLGRRHDPATARRAVALALEAGFPTVSLDLIYGLPGQTPRDVEASLADVVRLDPHHLSCYQLTVSEGTAFARRRARGRLVELGEDAQADLFLHVHGRVEELGWEAYEVSNFARAPRHRSAHNRKYWDHVPYLGLGPSACSFDGGRRSWNERALGAWSARVARGERPVAGEERLAPEELALESLFLGLRRREGLDLAAWRARHGTDLLARNGAVVEAHMQAGLCELEAGRLRLTRRGLAVADAVVRALDAGP